MTRLIRHLFALLLLVLLAGLGGRPAFAHAVLLETSPARGSLLAEPPGEIALRFNEPVSPISLLLIGQDASRTLAAVARDEQVIAAVPGDLPHGSYLVSYRVVSADSHPVSGAFLFTVGAPVAQTLRAPDLHEREESWRLLVVFNRILLLASLAFAGGGALFAGGVLDAAHPLAHLLQRPLRIGALIAILSALLAVPLQGGLLTAPALNEPATWLGGEIFRVGWQSHLGRSAALTCLGLAAVAVCGASQRRHWRLASVAGALLAAGALAASGHAATASPRWLASLAMVCHAATMVFWAGSLWPLLRAVTLPAAEAARIVRRFSKLAIAAVAALIAAGLVLAVLQLDGDGLALVATAYGQLLLLKLLLVALLLLLAIYNKRRLTPALARGEQAAAERLANAIRLEIAAIGLILAVTALLGQTPPPRAVPADRPGASLHGSHAGHAVAAAQSATAVSNGYTATATLMPSGVGRNTLAVTLRGPDGNPFSALEARAEFSLPQAGVDSLDLPLSLVAPGHYQGTTDALIVAGTWQMRLILLIDDFDQVTVEFALRVR